MRKFLKFITSRLFVLGIMLFTQIVFIALFCLYLVPTSYGVYSLAVFYVLNVFAIIVIVNSKSASAYKIAWATAVATLPLGGGFILWFMFANKRTTKRQKAKLSVYRGSIEKYSKIDNSLLELKDIDLAAYNQCRYIYSKGKCSCYDNSEVTYFKLGDYAFPEMVKKLKNAKKFIFVEYFIIEPGIFWNTILEILKEKAKEGVDVRIIYDDFGCMSKVNWNYNLELISYGFKVLIFNRYLPIVNVKMNFRDHRKLLIIDGVVGFTGGINIADEYINKVHRFGLWKDNCIMILGPAVFGMTSLFLSNWSNLEKKDIDFLPFSYETNKELAYKINPSGFVQTYGDLPYDYESIGENVYLNLIYKAKKYVYISTPYLIPDGNIISALTSAARSGIDVRLVIPGIPDKKIVYQATLSYLTPLVRAGVKVFIYSKGFVHGKTFISDDEFSTVGTINLDLRSLYLHMENATFMYKCDCIKDIKNDFDEMFANSKTYTIKDYENTNIFLKIFRAFIRLFSVML